MTVSSSSVNERAVTRFAVATFAAFCLAYLAVKLATISAAHYDYAKEIYNAQALRWVYEAANPPLYTWLLHGLSRLIGPGIETVLILNHLLIFAVVLAAFALGRRLFGSALNGAFAAALLLALHQVFRFQFARTHSLLLVLFALLALLAFVALLREGRARDYLLLGLVLGAGLLSKFNFAGFIAVFFVGALMVGGGRRALFTWRVGLTVLALLAVIVPMVLAGGDRWAALAEIFRMKTGTGAATGVGGLAPLVGLASALVSFVAVPAVAAAVALVATRVGSGPATVEAERDEDQALRILVAMLSVGAMLPILGVLAGIVERVSGRFLLAFLLTLPFVLAGIVLRFAPSAARLRSAWLGIVVVLLVQAAIRILDLTPYCSGKCTDLAPYDRLADKLRTLGAGKAAITTDDLSVAGNLVGALPGASVAVAGVRRLTRPVLPRRTRCLFIWRADVKRDRPGPPLVLINASGLGWRAALDRVQTVSIPWRWTSRDRFQPMHTGNRRSWSWGYILLRAGEGSCRRPPL